MQIVQERCGIAPDPRRWRRKLQWGCIGVVVFFLLALPFPAFSQSTNSSDPTTPATSPQSQPSQPRQYLFGDWDGERTALADKGVTFDFFYVADLQANPTGGLQQTYAGWGRIRGTMDVDFGKLTGWHGLSFHVTGLWQFGGNLGERIGVLANPSGLVSAHTTRLDSFWLQEALFHDHLFLMAGQMAGLDFYGDQAYGGSYLIEPIDYAYGNLFSNTYESFNPAGTPAVQARVVIWKTLYVQSAVLSGNRNPYVQDPNGLHFKIADSPVFAFETGFSRHSEYLNGQTGDFEKKLYPGLYKFGATYNAGKFTDANGVVSPGNYLIYGSVNQALYRERAGSSHGVDGFFGFDWSPNDVNRENSQITLGARYNGPIPARPQDAASFGFVYTHIGDPFQTIGVPAGAPPLGTEKAVELNYAANIRPYFLVQPVFQYYFDPGANPRVPNAAVFGFRTKVTF